MKLQFIGCGDAFGSGGRFNACFHVIGKSVNFLIDCGATSLVALKARMVPLNEIRTIVITHFHADHFGGIPFLMLDAQFNSKRTQPLTIVGPNGLNDRFVRAMETAFPGSSKSEPKFKLSLIELKPRESVIVDEIRITPFSVIHGGPSDQSYAYRFEAEGRSIAYTGDTEWTDELIEAGKAVDLLIAEAYFYEKRVRNHLDLATLTDKLPVIRPSRIILTHMSEDMLSRVTTIPYQAAEDGMVVEM